MTAKTKLSPYCLSCGNQHSRSDMSAYIEVKLDRMIREHHEATAEESQGRLL